jgi:hypothetical protein
MPAQASVARPTEVWVQLCLPDSPGFKDDLPQYTKSGEEIAAKDVRSGILPVRFPREPTSGNLLPIRLRIELSAPDFKLDQSYQETRLLPGIDSGCLIFTLHPERNRQRSLVILTAKQDLGDGTYDTLGSVRLFTRIEPAGFGKVLQTAWMLVSSTSALLVHHDNVGSGSGTQYNVGSGFDIQYNVGSGSDTQWNVNGLLQPKGDAYIGSTHNEQQYGGVRFGEHSTVSEIDLSVGSDYILSQPSKGDNNRISLNQEALADQIARLFIPVFERIWTDPNVDQQELVSRVVQIQHEVRNGEQASPTKVELWLRQLVSMAPEIAQVVASVLTSPAADIATEIRLVAEKIAAEVSEQ